MSYLHKNKLAAGAAFSAIIAFSGAAIADGVPKENLDELGITLNDQGDYVFPDGSHKAGAAGIDQTDQYAVRAEKSLSAAVAKLSGEIETANTSRDAIGNGQTLNGSWTNRSLETRSSANLQTNVTGDTAVDTMSFDGRKMVSVNQSAATHPASNTTTTVVGGDASDAFELHTHTTTTTQTTTRAPKPKVKVAPCELIDACDNYNTLRLIDAVQTEKAVLEARTELSKARTALKEAECKEREGCEDSEAASRNNEGVRRSSIASYIPQPNTKKKPRYAGPMIRSVFGIEGKQMTAELDVKGARVRVTSGDDVAGRVIQTINRSGVTVMYRGRLEQLPFYSVTNESEG